MDGGSSSSLSELIERARALEFALTVLPTATQDYSERVDSQQQSPACEENESVKYFPAPSEGEWIAASLPCPRKNATPLQRRRDEVARALSPIIPGVDGDETVSDEETPPPLPPRPVAIPEGKGQVVPRNERLEKLQALVDFGENISKFAKNLRKKLVKIFDGPFISHFGKERKRRNDELEASSTDDEETTTEVCDKSPSSATRQYGGQNTKGVFLAPGTYSHEVVIFRKKRVPRRRRNRLPVIVVTFEDGWEGWRYVQRCKLRQDIDVVGIRVKRRWGRVKDCLCGGRNGCCGR